MCGLCGRSLSNSDLLPIDSIADRDGSSSSSGGEEEEDSDGEPPCNHWFHVRCLAREAATALMLHVPTDRQGQPQWELARKGGNHFHCPTCHHCLHEWLLCCYIRPLYNKRQEDRVCALPSCRARNVRTKHCSRCREVRYCSAECQREHWPAHKATCHPPTAGTPGATSEDAKDEADSEATTLSMGCCPHSAPLVQDTSLPSSP